MGYINTGLLALLVIALLIGVTALFPLRRRISSVTDELERTMSDSRRLIGEGEALLRELRQGGLLDRAKAALDSTRHIADKVGPITASLAVTLTEARTLLDDATQTSQSVRGRVEDLAATQRELNELTRAMADIAADLKDNDISGKLSNLLTDASLLAADFGILAENANSYLERGKPIVENIGDVVAGAKKRVRGIKRAIGSLKEGVKAGAHELVHPEH